MRRGLLVGLVALSLVALPLLASACSRDQAAAQPSHSPTSQVRLLEASDFSLLSARPMHLLVHVTSRQRLHVAILAEQLLDSWVLRRVAAADGSPRTPQAIRLTGGTNGGARTELPYALYSTPLEPGYYRLELTGHGRIISIIVEGQPWT